MSIGFSGYDSCLLFLRESFHFTTWGVMSHCSIYSHLDSAEVEGICKHFFNIITYIPVCASLLLSHSFRRLLHSRSLVHSRSPTSRSTSHSHSSKRRRTKSRSHKQRSKSSSPRRRSRSQSPPPRRRSRSQSPPPRKRLRSRSPRHSSSSKHQSRPHSPRTRWDRYCIHCRTEI